MFTCDSLSSRFISWVENCAAILRAKINMNYRKTEVFSTERLIQRFKNIWRIIPNIRCTALIFGNLSIKGKVIGVSPPMRRGKVECWKLRYSWWKEDLSTPLCRRWQLPLKGKGSKPLGLILCNLTHRANSQNTATTGLFRWKIGMKWTRPLAAHRLSVAVFLSVAGYSPFRTISVGSEGWGCWVIWVSAFNQSLA